MISTLCVWLSKMFGTIGRGFLKMSRALERSKRSVLVQKSADRDLYRTPSNDMFWLSPQGYIDQCIIRDGVFEEPSVRIVERLVKRGDTVLDVGANIGYYSVLLSRLVGPTGRVVAFEPTERFERVLRMNLEANGISNVEVHRLGLSEKRAQLPIGIGDSSATLHTAEGASFSVTETIDLVSLDEFVGERPLNRIDFVKVDIDGHEPLFLAGAWKTLERLNPLVLLEVSHLHYLKAGFTAWDFYDLLKQRGYRIFDEQDLAEISTKFEFLTRCGNFAYSRNIVITRGELRV